MDTCFNPTSLRITSGRSAFRTSQSESAGPLGIGSSIRGNDDMGWSGAMLAELRAMRQQLKKQGSKPVDSNFLTFEDKQDRIQEIRTVTSM